MHNEMGHLATEHIVYRVLEAYRQRIMVGMRDMLTLLHSVRSIHAFSFTYKLLKIKLNFTL